LHQLLGNFFSPVVTQAGYCKLGSQHDGFENQRIHFIELPPLSQAGTDRSANKTRPSLDSRKPATKLGECFCCRKLAHTDGRIADDEKPSLLVILADRFH